MRPQRGSNGSGSHVSRSSEPVKNPLKEVHVLKQSVAALAMIAALLLASCGGTPAAPSGGGEAPAEQPAGGGEAVTLNFLTLDGDDMIAATNAVIDAWKKSDPKYANVTVNIQAVPFADIFPAIETAVASGAELDLFLADGPDMKHYAFNNAAIPLEKYFTKEEIAAFLPINVEAGTYKGVFYSPGIMESCSNMFFNKDMTDAAGINPPEVLTGWTMEEALPNWQKTVQRDGSSVTVWGLRWGQGTYWGDYEHGIVRRAAGPKGSPTNMGMAPDGVTFKGYMDTPEALAAFEFQRSWYRGENPVSPQEPIPDIFFNKQSAFYISPDNAIGTINRKYPNGDFRFGVMGIPGFANGSQVCHTDSWHFGVSPASKQQDLAAALVKYMTGPEGAKIWFGVIKQLPARTELLNTVPEYKEMPQKLFAEAVQAYGQPRIGTPGYTEYQQVFAELMKNLAQTDAPVSELVADAVSKIESAVAKYKGWND